MLKFALALVDSGMDVVDVSKLFMPSTKLDNPLSNEIATL